MLMLESRMVLLGLRTATLFLAIFTVEVTSPGATQWPVRRSWHTSSHFPTPRQRIQMKRQYRRRHRICRLTPQFLPHQRHSLFNQMQKFGNWVLWQISYTMKSHCCTKERNANGPTRQPLDQSRGSLELYIQFTMKINNCHMWHSDFAPYIPLLTASHIYPGLPRSS